MKIIEKSQPSKSALGSFSERQFTIELNGFQLCALAFIAERVGGAGKLRSVFSEGRSLRHDNYLLSDLLKVKGLPLALNELGNAVTVSEENYSIYVDDTLDNG